MLLENYERIYSEAKISYYFCLFMLGINASMYEICWK